MWRRLEDGVSLRTESRFRIMENLFFLAARGKPACSADCPPAAAFIANPNTDNQIGSFKLLCLSCCVGATVALHSHGCSTSRTARQRDLVEVTGEFLKPMQGDQHGDIIQNRWTDCLLGWILVI